MPGIERALETIHQQAPDLIIIELDGQGVSLLQDCKRLRDSTAAPILVISSTASEADKIEALTCCADDYVTQPFGTEELLPSIRALLRRSGTPEQASATISAGEITIRTGEHRVELAGREIKLTPKEFEVLAYLVANSGKVVTHPSLLQAVWGELASEQDEGAGRRDAGFMASDQLPVAPVEQLLGDRYAGNPGPQAHTHRQ